MTDERYTHGHGDAVLRSHRWRTAENSAGYLLDELQAGRSLLDVGCGPGNLTADLARLVAPGRVVGIDASPDVIAQATAQYGALANVEFRVADLYTLPFADDSFDVVHAHQVLQHVADPVAALVEMRRVAKAGGVVAARDGDYSSFAWYPADPLLDRWLEVYGQVARANAGEPDGGRYLKAWAHAAGLGDLTLTVTSWCFATDEEQAWWGGLWAERITTSPMAGRAIELGIATADELESIAEAWRRWAAHPDAWISIPSTELLARLP